jgi:hypothetical protein
VPAHTPTMLVVIVIPVSTMIIVIAAMGIVFEPYFLFF